MIFIVVSVVNFLVIAIVDNAVAKDVQLFRYTTQHDKDQNFVFVDRASW